MFLETRDFSHGVVHIKNDNKISSFKEDVIDLINDILFIKAHLDGHLRIIKLSIDYYAVADKNAEMGINVDFNLLQKYVIPYIEENVINAEKLNAQIISLGYSANSHDFKWEQTITGIVYLVDNSETEIFDNYINDSYDKSITA